MENVVSLHPYFTPHEGKMDEWKSMMPEFVSRTRTEAACYYYEFTIGDGVIFCREGYNGAEGALAHVANVDDLLQKALTISDLTRFEIHGPAAELAKLKEPFGALNPDWYELECGI